MKEMPRGPGVTGCGPPGLHHGECRRMPATRLAATGEAGDEAVATARGAEPEG